MAGEAMRKGSAAQAVLPHTKQGDRFPRPDPHAPLMALSSRRAALII